MYWRELVAGVDEAGRGPLAGPVVAAAVILNPFQRIEGLADSKILNHQQREELDTRVKSQAVAWAVGRAGMDEIDQLNILAASMLAMQRAVDGLRINGLAVIPDHVVVDGNRVPPFPCPADWFIKGDGRIDSIRAASILAKVCRDAEMLVLDAQYPEYGLAENKGYGTKEHLAALARLGPSPFHRRSFAPVRDCDFENAGRQKELF